ncbi:hypothetical protein DPMN_054541 [Dreissena polymorpha]|uniref:Uncharacterized protein n=1 Tax=Dreissena polymorpha TaxID=45954 RepID=A0A9D4CNB1_DREPO|nr:hypothetical protein DPMN_054541 [Dreissena polymorpha]
MALKADETNSTPETEEMSDNRSPDLSFENEADGLLVESSASLLDVSLRVSCFIVIQNVVE